MTRSVSTFTSSYQLVSQLDELVVRGSRYLRSQSAQRSTDVAKWRITLLLFVVPVIFLVLQVVAFGIGIKIPLLGFRVASVLSVFLPLIYVGGRLTWIRFFERVERPSALSVFDSELGLKDRLVTADEFLRRGQITGFFGAAIMDAMPAIERSLKTDLRVIPVVSFPTLRRYGVSVLIAMLLVILADEIDVWQHSSPESAIMTDGPATDAERIAAAAEEHPGNHVKPRTQSGVAADITVGNEMAGIDAVDLPSGDQSVLNRPKELVSSSASSRSGLVTDSRRKTSDKDNQNQYAPGERQWNDRKTGTRGSVNNSTQEGQNSGAPQQGAAVQDDSVRKDQEEQTSLSDNESTQKQIGKGVGTPQALSDDNGLPKENESRAGERGAFEEDAGGSRDAPVPTVGNTESPTDKQQEGAGPGNSVGQLSTEEGESDSIGNGGRNEQKQSRGVASLILSDAIAEHMEGRMNAGPIKTTQQGALPSSEYVVPLEAEDRQPRSTRMGSFKRQQFSASEELLVRDFFLTTRERSGSE